MDTNCAPLVADLFLLCEISRCLLSDVVEAFNSTAICQNYLILIILISSTL